MRKLLNFSKAAFWIGLIFLLYVFAILTNETGKNYKLRSKSDELDAQISQLQDQIDELGYSVTYYKTDAYQDKLAREKLGLQKPGESVVIIKKDTSQQPAIAQQSTVEVKTTQELEKEKSHWQQWRDFLFGS